MFNKEDPSSLIVEMADHQPRSSSIHYYYQEFNQSGSLHTDPNYQYSEEHNQRKSQNKNIPFSYHMTSADHLAP